MGVMVSGSNITAIYGSVLIFVVSRHGLSRNGIILASKQDQGNLVFLSSRCSFKCIRAYLDALPYLHETVAYVSRRFVS